MNRRIAVMIAEDEQLIAAGRARRAPDFPDVFNQSTIEQNRATDGLLYLYLEFVNVCNLGCKGCWNGYETELREYQEGDYHRQSGVSRGLLSTADYQRIIEQAADAGVRYINYIGGGEPLISSSFFPLVERARELGLSFELFTNGTLINAETAHRLFELEVAPFVKLYSLNSERHDRMVSRVGAHEKVISALEHLRSAGYGTVEYPRAAIETVISHHNYKEIPALWRFARDRGFLPFFERFVGTDYDGDPGALPSPRQLLDLYTRIRDLDRTEYGYTFPLVPHRIGFSCNPVMYGVYVQTDGTVKLCAGCTSTLGNIRDLPLTDIVKSSSALQRVRYLEERPSSYCGRCLYRQRHECYGCPGQAEIMGGDMAGDDPLCFHIPENLERPHGGLDRS